MTSFNEHFKDQIGKYGSQIVVNLVNQKGYEFRVFEAFGKAIKDQGSDQVK